MGAKYSIAVEATYGNINGACVLHAGYIRLQTYTQNMLFIAVPLQKRLHQGASILGFVSLIAY